MRPGDEDDLERVADEPEGHHTREKTAGGYPLMGSSPAERHEAAERGKRLQREAMRGHAYEGEGPYCRARLGTPAQGGPEVGWVFGWVECGYPAELHPLGLDQAWGEAARENWARTAVAAAGKSWATHMVKFGGAVVPRG